MKNKKEEKLLSVSQYARKHKIVRQTVYNRIGDGTIPKKDIVLVQKTVVRIKDK